MDLLDNSFHILNATLRDDRRKIVELSDERSLLIDPDDCSAARAILTHPRKRLTAEISWLPGLGPKKTREVLALLEESLNSILEMESIASVARANLMAAGLSRKNDFTVTEAVLWLHNLARAFDGIATEKVISQLNEERIVSGFPEITNTSAVEEEIQERRRYYRQICKLALNKLPSRDLVQTLTELVDLVTNCGDLHGPILIDDLVDTYEVEAQGFLTKEGDKIKALIEKLRAAADAEEPDSVLDFIVESIIKTVKNWDTVAQPIQVSTKSRGLEHGASHDIASIIRELSIYLHNEHGLMDIPRQLTDLLQEVFAEVVEVAENASIDATTLKELADGREEYLLDLEKQTEEWAREITYATEIGLLFKDKLQISPDGIEWKNQHWDIKSITAFRWGGVRRSVNGIPTGTDFTVVWSDGTRTGSLVTRKKEIFNNFTDRMWKAVGARLLTEFLEGLSDGKKYQFGSAVVNDLGMTFWRKKLFSSNEPVFCRWRELSIGEGPGCFRVWKIDDKKVNADFEYLRLDNIQILEIAMRSFWKKGGLKLSSVFK
jgi:hypothetical protein